MPSLATPSRTSPAPFAFLDAAQVGLVIELLDTRWVAPRETAARFFRLGEDAGFTAGQQDAIEGLFELDEAQLADALLSLADDEDARELVREQLVHEARLHYVRA